MSAVPRSACLPSQRPFLAGNDTYVLSIARGAGVTHWMFERDDQRNRARMLVLASTTTS